MQIIPAVDIQNGKCVRLTQGKADTAIVYEDDPLKAALRWQDNGAQYLHIVDLDGAFRGEVINFEPIKRILSGIHIPAEVGGGIRILDNIKKYIDLGADRVVLGTQAAISKDFLEKSVNIFANKIAIAIDVSSGRITTEGWTKEIAAFPIDLAKKVKNAGVETIIYTDTAADGTLAGPNFGGIEGFAKEVKTKIIVSGGVSSIKDIKKLEKIEGIAGVIIGKALYTGKINLEEALKLC